eukprot:2994810-Amphidinium_carterae.1
MSSHQPVDFRGACASEILPQTCKSCWQARNRTKELASSCTSCSTSVSMRHSDALRKNSEENGGAETCNFRASTAGAG